MILRATVLIETIRDWLRIMNKDGYDSSNFDHISLYIFDKSRSKLSLSLDQIYAQIFESYHRQMLLAIDGQQERIIHTKNTNTHAIHAYLRH